MGSNPKQKKLSSNPSAQQTKDVTDSSRCSLSKVSRGAGLSGCHSILSLGSGLRNPTASENMLSPWVREESQEEQTLGQCEWCASPQVWRVPTTGGWYVDGGRKRGAMFPLMGAGQRRRPAWGVDVGRVKAQ